MTWNLSVSGHEEQYSEEGQREVAKVFKSALEQVASLPNILVSTVSFSSNDQSISGDIRSIDL